jgi:hypothetical protein
VLRLREEEALEEKLLKLVRLLEAEELPERLPKREAVA